MNLQQFKLKISNSIVNRENNSFKTMDTEQLVDLFQFGNEKKDNKKEKKKSLGNLDELWSENQYDEFSNLDDFFATNEDKIE